jgi:glycosyltransferase involved in cell wall biosynthesis
VRALFVTTVLPANRRGGGEVVSQLFIDAARAAGWTVDVLGYQRRGDPPATGPGVRSVGTRAIETGARPLSTAGWLLSALARNEPYTTAKFRSRRYAELLAAALRREPPDVVIVDHSQMAWVLAGADVPAAVVLIAHNVEASLYAQLARDSGRAMARAAYRREARLVARVERRLAARATRIWALTDSDAAALGGRPFAVPGSASEVDAPVAPTIDVGLLGSWTWSANREGLLWFAREVLPHLPADTSIHVAGRGAEELQGRHPGLRIVGLVPDAAAFLQSARVLAVPSTGGGGVQIKTLDAIASGRPVVATSAALRGIDAPPASVRRCDDPPGFASLLSEHAGAEPDETLRRAALEWSRARRERFFADVRDALAEARR